jgi:hypothetical protein
MQLGRKHTPHHLGRPNLKHLGQRLVICGNADEQVCNPGPGVRINLAQFFGHHARAQSSPASPQRRMPVFVFL